ncbi:uncharacterized protein LOC118448607 [Vespa mandarinia]|uniref:uncharacterized protein LOC118448607 n=1 Tax=Vespa mandarinia TaxID=7446 RepID=UPI00161360D8|nr:uncharacterized protein LOC118448607 [Vespa mandarinia]
MFRGDLTNFEQHFLFSNRLVALVIGLHPNRNLNNQLFLVCLVTIYLFPIIVHQLCHLTMLKLNLQSSVKLLHKLFVTLLLVLTYTTTYFSFITMKKIFARIKCDYLQFADEKLLNIIEKYTIQSQLHTFIIVSFFSLYFISMTFPSILSVLLYIFGALDDNQLLLPFTENDGLFVGALYYNLLIYQLIGAIILLMIGSSCYSIYLVCVQHACCQLSLIIFKIREQFKMNQKHTKTNRNSKTHLDEFDWMIDIIKHYKNVTEFVQLMNCFSEITYLIAVFFATILIVFDFLYMYQLSEILHSLMETFGCSINIFVSILILYLNFYIGQNLLNHSEEVFDELCKIPFYNLSMESQKLLLFMIMRSMKPCMLSIGKMCVSSNKIFAGVRSFILLVFNASR